MSGIGIHFGRLSRTLSLYSWLSTSVVTGRLVDWLASASASVSSVSDPLMTWKL